MHELTQHTAQMLNIGRQTVRKNPFLVNETGTTNTKGDRTIEMDVKIEIAFLEYIRRNKLPVWVYSEEIGIVKPHPKPDFLVTFDPLDGSDNYILGQGLLPFGSLIAFYHGSKPRLKDVVAAGAIEYTTNRLYLFDNGQTTDENGNKVQLRNNWELDQKTPVYLETYAKGYEKYRSVGSRLFVKNQGALVSSLIYVLGNSAAAMGGIAIKSEEVGAIYALISGAGGLVISSMGNGIQNLALDHNRKYDVLAGDKSTVKLMAKMLG
ncbi:hypothetical protein HYU45_03705 [Candidatus Daviesbacteria bacterium]|nr:hypothetical protein [Candidatus Daviesbacteria bacterium]